jgi:hypothetical protein
VAAVDSGGRTFFVADAHRGDGKHFVVDADEKLMAFLEPGELCALRASVVQCIPRYLRHPRWFCSGLRVFRAVETIREIRSRHGVARKAKAGNPRSSGGDANPSHDSITLDFSSPGDEILPRPRNISARSSAG